MNSHKHGRLTYARRIEMVQQMIEEGLSAPLAATRHGVWPPTARKWLGRYLAGGQAALADASSRPAHSPRAIEPAKALLIVERRQRRMLQAKIAASDSVFSVGVGCDMAWSCKGLSRQAIFTRRRQHTLTILTASPCQRVPSVYGRALSNLIAMDWTCAH